MEGGEHCSLSINFSQFLNNQHLFQAKTTLESLPDTFPMVLTVYVLTILAKNAIMPFRQSRKLTEDLQRFEKSIPSQLQSGQLPPTFDTFVLHVP